MFATDARERAGFDFNFISGYSHLLAPPAPTPFGANICVNDITRLLTNSRRYYPIPEFPEIIPPQGVWLKIAD